MSTMVEALPKSEKGWEKVSWMPKVLLLTSNDEEAASLLEILHNYAFLVHAPNIPELQSRLEEGDYDALFCAWPFYLASWKGALQEVRKRFPDLPVIVLSRTWGERGWKEVVEAGAFDLLALPSQRPTVLGVVEQAVVSHEARKARKSVGLSCWERQAS